MGERKQHERLEMRPVTLDRDLADRIAGASGKGLVSILIPTHRMGPETAQDRIRLKNALAELDELMDDAGWRRPSRETQLAGVRHLLDDEEFWAHQGDGLACYVGDDGEVTAVAVGEALDTTITVASAFHVRHLFPPLERECLQALVLTKGSVGLFDVDVHGAKVADADLPRSMDDVNWFIDYESQTQRHADRAGSAGIQHGHDPSDRMHEDLGRFLRAVADALPHGAGPLAVLGDDPVIDEFRKITPREVVGLDLDGTDRAQSPAEVHRRVQQVIESRFAARLRANREAAETALGSQDVITLFPEALSAATTGRLSRVFVRRGAAPVWGSFDADSFEAHAVSTKTVGTVDLVDRLAVVARSLGADVRAFDERIDSHDFVAVCRF